MRRLRIAFTVSLILVYCLVLTRIGQVVRAASDYGLAWAVKAPMLLPTHGAAAAVGPNGKIYAFGGSHDNWGYCADTQEYDPIHDSWALKTPMSIRRGGHGAAAINGKIYVIGGIPYPMSYLLNLNEAYDATTDTWTRNSPMPTPRMNFAMTANSDGKIYVMGGQAYPGTAGIPSKAPWGWWWVLNSLEVYDPATDTWETKAAMPTYRTYFRCLG